MSTIKTRFAPSPTGHIHFGNVRTALFNVLFARRHEGVFLLRIEDTDAERSRQAYTEQLMADLEWLGLDWQEGEGRGGPHAPYAQSQRGAIYEDYMQQLRRRGRAYRCFCSAVELELSRKQQAASGRPPRYSGRCAHLSEAEADQKAQAGASYTWRFRMPRGEMIQFDDLVRGAQKFPSDDIGDFIIRRSDGSFAFFFTNAIDDALMAVSHVLRGEDHLTNTPRQIALLQALDLPVPAYGHISLIVDGDGRPLSKRSGSMSVIELREQGYLPLAVCNYLARLGHHYPQDGLLDARSLASLFEVGSLGRAPARYDRGQLDHWQAQAVQQLAAADLVDWLSQALAAIPAADRQAFALAIRPNILFPADARDWVDVFYGSSPAYTEEAKAVISHAGKEFFRQAADCLQADGDYKAFTQRVKSASGAQGKALFMPLRAALTGRTFGPELPEPFRLMGIDRVRSRLLAAAC